MLVASALVSTVKNTSGQRRFFGELPPKGRELAADQEFTVYGDIREAIVNKAADRQEARRSILALERDLQAARLQIISTPSPILKDGVTGEPTVLVVNSGVLGSSDAYETVSPSPT